MDYQLLTSDHRRMMWERVIGNAEEQHYALEMECVLTLAATSGGDEKVRATGTEQIAAKRRDQANLARQIAEAQAQLAQLAAPPADEQGKAYVLAATAD